MYLITKKHDKIARISLLFTILSEGMTRSEGIERPMTEAYFVLSTGIGNHVCDARESFTRLFGKRDDPFQVSTIYLAASVS